MSHRPHSYSALASILVVPLALRHAMGQIPTLLASKPAASSLITFFGVVTLHATLHSQPHVTPHSLSVSMLRSDIYCVILNANALSLFPQGVTYPSSLALFMLFLAPPTPPSARTYPAIQSTGGFHSICVVSPSFLAAVCVTRSSSSQYGPTELALLHSCPLPRLE